jgi:hypothetical protein
MSLNRNNFLRFNGSFTKRNFSFSYSYSPQVLYANEDSIKFEALSTCTATNGIDTYSFKIIRIFNYTTGNPPIELAQYPFWDGTTYLTTYRPLDLTVLNYAIEFTFKDRMGNESPKYSLIIAVSAISVSWAVYPISTVCRLDSFGYNNGYQGWSQLKLVNSATLTDIVPLTLKDNVPSDPDYISDVQNYSLCPPPSTTGYNTLIIANFTKKNIALDFNYITITSIYLASSVIGAPPPTTLNIPCSIGPNQTQRFNIPSGNYDTGLTISYTVNGNMVTATPQRYWLVNNGGSVTGWASGGLTSNPVDNSGIYGNFALVIPPSGGNVITIFAQ